MTAPLSFEEFVETESPALFRRLCVVRGDRHEAEEVLQDSLLTVFGRWERVREMNSTAVAVEIRNGWIERPALPPNLSPLQDLESPAFIFSP